MSKDCPHCGATHVWGLVRSNPDGAILHGCRLPYGGMKLECSACRQKLRVVGTGSWDFRLEIVQKVPKA